MIKPMCQHRECLSILVPGEAWLLLKLLWKLLCAEADDTGRRGEVDLTFKAGFSQPIQISDRDSRFLHHDYL